MGSALVVALVKYGLLVLLWVFVLVTVRTIRVDLWGRPAERRDTKPKKTKQHRGSAHKVVVTEGPLKGTELRLSTQPVTLGRGDDCTLVLADDYASTHHAQLTPDGGRWCLEDLGSTNGTYLGKAKVTRPTTVPLGTPIRIGKTTLELRS
jgi:pSer/pThr/pTyr-binding forkhead associated (FHA) protein